MVFVSFEVKKMRMFLAVQSIGSLVLGLSAVEWGVASVKDRFRGSIGRVVDNKPPCSCTGMARRAAFRIVDDELMLNVLRCHLTY